MHLEAILQILGSYFKFYWVLVPQELILLEITCVLIKYLKFSLILEILYEHINLLLNIENRSLLLDFFVQFRPFRNSLSEKELLSVKKDLTELSKAAILKDHVKLVLSGLPICSSYFSEHKLVWMRVHCRWKTFRDSLRLVDVDLLVNEGHWFHLDLWNRVAN